MLVLAGYLWAELGNRVRALRAADRDRGASALEWAIIAAISVVIATIIGAIVYNVVQTKAADVQNCANQPVSSQCK